jgi:hypothetical protein
MPHIQNLVSALSIYFSDQCKLNLKFTISLQQVLDELYQNQMQQTHILYNKKRTSRKNPYEYEVEVPLQDKDSFLKITKGKDSLAHACHAWLYITADQETTSCDSIS